MNQVQGINPNNNELPENNQQIKNEKANGVKKKNTGKYIAITILILLSMTLIGIGIYTSYISNPKRIIATSTEKLTNQIKEFLQSNNEELNLGNNYTLTSKIKLAIDSDYLTMYATTDPTYLAYTNLLKNLNQTENTLILSQDQKNQKLLANWTTTLNQKELLNGKYLIENSTQYYYIKNFLETYINDGNSNYFETLAKDETAKENFIYIYDTVVKSFKENLKDNYFSKYQEITTIDNKDQKLTKVSFKITDKILKEIANAILKDLKNDEKANSILTGINENFKKMKIKEDASILGEKQELELNVYTDNLTYQAKKYELRILEDTREQKITYEKGKNDDKIYISEESNVLARLDIKQKQNKTEIKIISSKEQELGTITIEKTNKNTSISATIKDKETSIDFDYNSKISDIKKNTSYKNDIELSLKVVSDNINIINANINMSNDITNKVNINEDVSTSVLASTITQEQQQALMQQITNILIQLMMENQTL